MLRVAEKWSELDLDRLMEIYTGSDRERMEEYLREDLFAQPGAAYYIWADHCSALRLEPYEDGLLLSALQTRPDARNRGCAKALVNAVLKRLPEGTKVYSHVARKNRASLAVHASCGFQKEKDFARLLDGTVTNRYVTLVWQVRAEIS